MNWATLPRVLPPRAYHQREAWAMKGGGEGKGPAAFLSPGSSWLDSKVTFRLPPGEPASIQAACHSIWEISRAIRARRGELRLSQVDVADRAGIRRQTLADIETGTRWPDASSLLRVCSTVGLEFEIRTE